MKVEIILEIVSIVCFILGCILYINYDEREDKYKKIIGILCIIFTSIGLGLFIGITNKPYTPKENNTEEVIEENINEDEINP